MKKTIKLIALLPAIALTMIASSCSSKAGTNGYSAEADDSLTTDSVTEAKEDNSILKNVIAVDLGLPSGTLWANMNVGATAPEQLGDYFQWGETTPCTDKRENVSSIKNYAPGGEIFKGSKPTDFGTELDPLYSTGKKGEYNSWTCNIAGDVKYDAAAAIWGKPWKMPTQEQLEELIDKCRWNRTVVNGVWGYRVTGSNGNSIFLPFAGERADTDTYMIGRYGHYWSSDSKGHVAYCLNCSERGSGWDSESRKTGFSIRPVTSDLSAVTAEEVEETAPSIGRIDGHDYVDLGLPSKTKWASMNVGATSVEDFGGYYECGETDVARANWGGKWQTPTQDQLAELLRECGWKWTVYNGTAGVEAVGPNGNTIFFPASGWCARNEIDYTNERGYYRTCTIYKDNPALVNGMTFSKDSKVDWYPISRTTGFSVRAVHE